MLDIGLFQRIAELCKKIYFTEGFCLKIWWQTA